MANKLFLICATLALCFLLINASSYRTTVEFDQGDDDDDDPDPSPMPEKCLKEFQQEQHLQPCQRWIRRQLRTRLGRGSGPSPEDDEFNFEDDIKKPNQRYTIIQECCEELRKEEPVCVCPSLKQAARAVRLQGQHSPDQATKINRIASHLPSLYCHIRGVGVCPFGYSSFWLY